MMDRRREGKWIAEAQWSVDPMHLFAQGLNPLNGPLHSRLSGAWLREAMSAIVKT
jgi:hypothetical protein